MDAGPVSPPPAPSWSLAPDIGKQTQGFVVTGFGDLPTGRALFLRFDWPDTAPPGWLDRLLAVAPITSAVAPDKTDADAQTRAASIAFAGTGLRKMGLTEAALASFTRPFHEGMFQEDRLRRLGDRRLGEWLETVIPDGAVWSANTPLRAPAPNAATPFDVPPVGDAETHVETAVTVHALLLLYARDESDAQAWAATVQTALKSDHVTIVRTLELFVNIEQQGNFSREHFGFADALSQPLPYDGGGAVLVGEEAAKQDPVQGVPLGEFVIGYIDGHHENAPGPVVGPTFDGDDRPQKAGLLASDQAEGFYDLGRNGSYLVARELKQDVASFWNSMAACAAAIRAQDPEHTTHITGDWIAERVIGRDKNGHLLCPAGAVLPSCSNGDPDSSFTYYEVDPDAAGCPPGSHVRRAFPRDMLAPRSLSKGRWLPPSPDAKATLLQAANNHRILRRGRKFGPKLQTPTVDDGADRGLLFMCLNTDIERQFEFVQQTWLLNSSFATLFQEVDPLVGPAGPMTLRDEPLRRTIHVESFVRLVGGDYFFLPSLPALGYLARL